MSGQQAFLISQSVAAMIKAMGMQAENKQREALGESMAYTEEQFCELIDEYGISHNAALIILREER